MDMMNLSYEFKVTCSQANMALSSCGLIIFSELIKATIEAEPSQYLHSALIPPNTNSAVFLPDILNE